MVFQLVFGKTHSKQGISMGVLQPQQPQMAKLVIYSRRHPKLWSKIAPGIDFNLNNHALKYVDKNFGTF